MRPQHRTGTNSAVWRKGIILILLSPLLVFPIRNQAQQQPTQGHAAAETAGSELEADEQSASGVVTIEGRNILTVYQSIGSYTPKERAQRIADRIVAIAREGKIPPEAIATRSRDAWTEITAGEKVLMGVTDVDAEMAGEPREQLAAEDAGNIRQAIVNYRRDHSWSTILGGILYTVIVTLLLGLVLLVLRKSRLFLRARLYRYLADRSLAEKRTPWHVAATYIISLCIALGTLVRWILLIALLEAYLTIVLAFFSSTRFISRTVTNWLVNSLKSAANAGLNYLPNLFVIIIVFAVAAQLLRLVTMVFAEIEKGKLVLRGFYPDWAEPTAKLLRALTLILVIIIVFPYLPGSKSPAFQGVSIFVGVLLSLGSSSAVANGIAGIILTYMRSFLVGDWVKIGDTTGEVVEKNILVTRIVTPKQEIITIPNATVMNGAVLNYTREAKNAGVIFHTTVTIGYDAPWKTVHQLLIDAAHATQHVLTIPKPFVLQTALNDFYVAYELNAYTDMPRQMQFIYSDLHQNIQDKFNEAGVEICSPHFAALRDGNAIAIPGQYVAADYVAPTFRVGDKGKLKAAAKVAG